MIRHIRNSQFVIRNWRKARQGFTLMEVNLAMFVMAVGTLGLVSLYSFGYRENQQSIEDVRAASVAEVNMNALIAALSSTNMTWSQWASIGVQPSTGWGYYAGDGTGIDWEDNDDGQEQKINPPSLGAMNGTAGGIFGKIMGLSGSQATFYDGDGLACGLVVNNQDASGNVVDRCSVAFRCGKRAAALVFQPLYYTEVRFQGLRDQ